MLITILIELSHLNPAIGPLNQCWTSFDAINANILREKLLIGGFCLDVPLPSNLLTLIKIANVIDVFRIIDEDTEAVRGEFLGILKVRTVATVEVFELSRGDLMISHILSLGDLLIFLEQFHIEGELLVLLHAKS